MKHPYLVIEKSESNYDIVTKCKRNAPRDIVVPEGVKAISDKAFKGRKNIVSITLPEGLEGIFESAFEGCESLLSINIPDSVYYIEENVFNGCPNIKTPIYMKMGMNLLYVPKDVEEFAVPEIVKTIGIEAFSGCQSLRILTLPKSLETIRHDAFKGCNHLDITNKPVYSNDGQTLLYVPKNVRDFSVPECVTDIGMDAFYDCKKLKTVPFNHNHTPFALYIYDCAFMNCKSLTHIELPRVVAIIERNAFAGCSMLKCVKLPRHCVPFIGEAFSDCPSLEKMDIF